MIEEPKYLSRQREILKILKNNGKVDISNLSKLFSVTEMTIYRDLKKLQTKDNFIFTKRGAMVLNESTIFETPHMKRLSENKTEKMEIAGKAIGLLKSGETIFLDGSTTAMAFAELINNSNIHQLTILTSSPIIFNIFLTNQEIQLISIGGVLSSSNYSLYGYESQIIKDINIKKAFISCSGYSIKHGVTETVKEESNLKKILFTYCHEINLLADFSKYNNIATYTCASLKDIKNLIVDSNLSKENITKLQEFTKVI